MRHGPDELPSVTDGRPLAPQQSALRTAMAGLIGNVLEWFDFAVYGYFASVIGSQFFPQSSPAAQHLLAFAVFAIGFGARPFGSLVLGRVGDRIGRRALLVLSIAMMGGATLAIGLLPTYESIGVAAPVLLVLLRLIQGFSLGGEFTGSMVYTTECVVRGDARAAQQFDRGWRDARLHPRLGIRLAGACAARRGGCRGMGLASAVHRERCLLHRRLAPASRAARNVGRVEGRRRRVRRLLPSLVADWRPIVQTFGIIAMTNAAYYLTFTYAVERRSSLTAAGRSFCSRTR